MFFCAESPRTGRQIAWKVMVELGPSDPIEFNGKGSQRR